MKNKVNSIFGTTVYNKLDEAIAANRFERKIIYRVEDVGESFEKSAPVFCRGEIGEELPQIDGIAFHEIIPATGFRIVFDFDKPNDGKDPKKETIDIVCDHLEIDRVKNFDLSNFYVKSFGLLGKETPINETVIPHLGEVKTLYPSYGIVEDDLVAFDDEINSIISWVVSSFPELKKFIE
jgi:hypothetical protein